MLPRIMEYDFAQYGHYVVDGIPFFFEHSLICFFIPFLRSVADITVWFFHAETFSQIHWLVKKRIEKGSLRV